MENDVRNGMGRSENAEPRTHRRALLKMLAGTAAGAALLHAGRARAKTTPPSRPAPATADEALAALKAGNERFVKHTPQVRDTVIAYPEQVTRVKATFVTAGQYVWHCHILEHEDNEMMRPFRVGPPQPGQPLP